MFRYQAKQLRQGREIFPEATGKILLTTRIPKPLHIFRYMCQTEACFFNDQNFFEQSELEIGSTLVVQKKQLSPGLENSFRVEMNYCGSRYFEREAYLFSLTTRISKLLHVFRYMCRPA